MATPQKTGRSSSVFIYVALAFIVGFLAGSGFAVFKLDSTSTGGQASSPHGNMSEQQIQAIAHLEEEVSNNPERFQAWTQLGNLYYDTGQYKEAVKAYETSLELHEGNANIWTDLGVMYRRTDRSEKAIEAFDKAIAMDPNHEISRLNKGIVLLYDLNNPKGAIESWENLVRINPNFTASNGEPIQDFIDEVKEKINK